MRPLPPAPTDRTLPRGFAVILDERTKLLDSGTTLLGGSPLRAVFITRQAAQLVRGRRVEVTSEPSAELARLLLDRGLAHPDLLSLANSSEPPESLATVVIPVQNRSVELNALLGTLPRALPVIVIDDGSDDPETIETICQTAGARCLRLEVNQGPSAARNRALEEVETPFAILIDSDLRFDPDVLELLPHFQDPTLAVVAPRVLSRATAEVWGPLADYERSHSSADRGLRPALIQPGGVVSWVPSACLVGRTEVLRGAFDESLRVAEDVDLCWRLAEKGWALRYDPSITLSHDSRKSVSEWASRKFYYGTGAARLASRHGGAVAPARFTPWSLAMTAALLPARWWSVLLSAALAVVPALRLREALQKSSAADIVAARSIPRTLWGVLTQGSALVLRHWSPVTAIAALVSSPVRRVVGWSVVIDSIVSLRSRLQATPRSERMSLPTVLWFLALRRVDDLAYGLGVWWGALKQRSLTALLPVLMTGSPSSTTWRSQTDDEDSTTNSAT